MKFLILLAFLVSVCLSQEALFDTSLTETMRVSESEQKDIDAMVSLRNGKLAGVYNINSTALNSDIVSLIPKNLGKKEKLVRIKKNINEDFWSGEENGYTMFGLRKTDEKYQGFISAENSNFLIIGLKGHRIAIIQTSDNFQCGVGN